MLTVATYLGYLAVAVPLTVWVARVLSRHGRVFLADVFDGDEKLAEAVSTLLLVGFYLLNLGFVMLYLSVDTVVTSPRALIEALSVKLGVVMLLLGVVHFGNLVVFHGIRRRSRLERLRPGPVPPPPHGYLPHPMGPPLPPAAR